MPTDRGEELGTYILGRGSHVLLEGTLQFDPLNYNRLCQHPQHHIPAILIITASGLPPSLHWFALCEAWC